MCENIIGKAKNCICIVNEKHVFSYFPLSDRIHRVIISSNQLVVVKLVCLEATIFFHNHSNTLLTYHFRLHSVQTWSSTMVSPTSPHVIMVKIYARQQKLNVEKQ